MPWRNSVSSDWGKKIPEVKFAVCSHTGATRCFDQSELKFGREEHHIVQCCLHNFSIIREGCDCALTPPKLKVVDCILLILQRLGVPCISIRLLYYS